MLNFPKQDINNILRNKENYNNKRNPRRHSSNQSFKNKNKTGKSKFDCNSKDKIY